MSVSHFTLVHVLMSLAGIGSGLTVLFGLINQKQLDGWTSIFIATSMLACISGFAFPFERLLRSHILGLLSLLSLIIAIFARYVFGLAGPGRWVYIVAAICALYFNCFAAVMQLFAKIPALKIIAPTQTEPSFLIAQLIVFVVLATLTVLAIKRFRTHTARSM